jgi:hypothetical protein
LWNFVFYRWKLHNGWKLTTNDGMVLMKSCTMDEKLKINCNCTHFYTFSSSNLVWGFQVPTLWISCNSLSSWTTTSLRKLFKDCIFFFICL